MKIIRKEDHFHIELCDKIFNVYWPSEFKFGENLIKRFCERITTQQLEALDKTHKLIEKYIDSGKTPPPIDDRFIRETIAHIYSIIHVQCAVYFSNVNLEYLKEFIDACYPRTYQLARKKLKQMFDERFDGCECELERQANEATCLDDWIVSRLMIAQNVANDIAELLRLGFLTNGKRYIKSNLQKEHFFIDANSFFFQAMKDKPCFSGFDKRGVSEEMRLKYINKINELYTEACKFDDIPNDHEFIKNYQLIQDSADYVELASRLDTLYLNAKSAVNLLSKENEIKHIGNIIALCDAFQRAIPKFKITDEKTLYTLSNEERRKVIVNFFAKWDAEMVDDIAYLKQIKEREEAIKKQKQERIDAEDRALTGMTQAEINAKRASENGTLEMEIKDQTTGEVVSSTPIVSPNK